MAIDSLELFDSGERTVSRTGSSQEAKFLAYGSEDTDAVSAFVAANLPPTLPGVFGDVLSWQDFKVSHVGGGVHEVQARYASQAPEFNFDVSTGGSTKATQSRKTLARYAAPGKTAPDFGGAINCTDDSVEGTDVPVAQTKFTEKHFIPRASFTPEYKDAVEKVTNRINDAPFRHYKTGEVRFCGMSSTQRGIEDVEGTFSFEVSRDDYGVRSGDLGVVDWAKDNVADIFGEDDDVYVTPGVLASPDPGSANNRLLDVPHEASVPGDTDVNATGPLTKLDDTDSFIAGATVYLDPAGFAVTTIGGGANVAVGLAQFDSDPGDVTVDINFTFTKADPEQAFDVATPLWVRDDATADNRAVHAANTLIGKAFVASAAGAETVRVMTIFKPGWAYIWFSYLTTTSESRLVRTPTSANVEQMFLAGDFTVLGIGSGPQ